MIEARGRIASIQVSRGGVPKLPVDSAEVSPQGLLGDRQRDTRAHGGPLRALCLFASEAIQALAAEGHNVAAGHLGENITVAGVDWGMVKPGARIRLGEAVECEVTSFAEPCWKNAHWFRDGDITRILQDRNPGFSRVYAKVLVTGSIAPGDEVVVAVESAAERVRRQQPKTFRWSPPS